MYAASAESAVLLLEFLRTALGAFSSAAADAIEEIAREFGDKVGPELFLAGGPPDLFGATL